MLLKFYPTRFKQKHLLVFIFIFCFSNVILFSVRKRLNTIPIITRSGETFFTSTATTCLPFTVSDSRPFFEREPPQINLPRRVSNFSDQSVLRHLRSLQLIILACARNVETSIDKFRNHIEPIVDLFHPSSRILIFESDSTDKTLKKLYQWSRAQIYTNGILIRSISSRSERIAYCRNELLNKAHGFNADYILMADIDHFSTNISAFVSNFQYNIDDWTVMTASTSDVYYDIWALRTYSDSVLNFDVWKEVSKLQNSPVGYCPQSVVDQIIVNHQKPIPLQHGLIEVRSAFNGAGLYKANTTYGCKYSGDNFTCEHVPFHLCIREKNRGRIFINPEFLFF